MAESELLKHLKKHPPICVYIVDEETADNIKILLNYSDNSIINYKHEKFIEDLIRLTNEKKINTPKKFIYKIRPLVPITYHYNELIKTGNGISNLHDYPLDLIESPFGEYYFGEDRKKESKIIKITYSGEKAYNQLFDNQNFFEKNIQTELWAICRSQTQSGIKLDFFQINE
jgi:hypothetical protein